MSKRFFRSLLSSLLAVMMVVTLAAVPSYAAPALSKSSVTLTKGYSTTLSVSGASGTVTWSTGDKSIATVTSKGKVSGKKVGSTYIYAKTGGKTLKCKVTVVAGKISLSKTSVSLDKGDKTTVNVKALGTHALSVKSTNSKVVKASWGSTKFDGDNISLVLTATGVGTARVKIYATKYSSSVYKYIDVTVEGDDYLIDDPTPSNPTNPTTPTTPFSLSTQTISMKAGENYTVYAYGATGVKYATSNTLVATVTASKTASGYTELTVKGENAGTATLRVMSNDTGKYIDVPITVTGSAQYYTVLDSQPAKINVNDISVTIDINGVNKYMLVPYDANFAMRYDVSKINDAVAAYEKASRYYSIYSNIPNKKANTDVVLPVSLVVANQTIYRYMLVPDNYDRPTADTVIAEYKGVYEYSTTYVKAPTKTYTSDVIKTWDVTIYDAAKKKNVVTARYMLLPYGYDVNAAENIIAKDKEKYQSNQEYIVLTSVPTNYDAATQELIFWANEKTGTTKFMLVPIKNCDYVKRNDAIYADTGVYCYYNAYSTDPTNTITDFTKEGVFSGLNALTGKKTYVLVNKNDADYEAKLTRALNGGAYSIEKRVS